MSRFMFLLCIVACTSAGTLIASDVMSQNLNEVHVSLTKGKATNLANLFQTLEKQSDYRFYYDATVGAMQQMELQIASETSMQELLQVMAEEYDLKITVNDKIISVARSSHQQMGHITGRVSDMSGSQLPGASVRVVGLQRSYPTDGQGKFSIRVEPGQYTLEVTYMSYATQRRQVSVKPGEDVVVDFSMATSSDALDEVVVVGYGTVRKRDLTGSVASVRGDELTAYVVPDPIMALQGRAPGVQIGLNTGAPDGDYTIRIRGVNSIKGDNSPLYIVDGIPFSTYTVNAYDIESIEILKDASATAIYGSRGANGVVMITTKRGQAGKTRVDYNFDYGIQSQVKKLDLMNAQEWASLYNEYLVNAAILETPAFSDAEVAAMGKGTDWQDVMFNSAAIANHNLTLSGGTENIKYHVSGSALLRDGMITNSSFDKYNVRSTLDIAATPMLDISAQLGYSSVNRMNQSDGGGHGGSSMIGAIYSASPLFTVYDEQGDYKDLRSWFPWSSHEIRNPMLMANESSYKTVSNLGNLNTSVTFKPVAGLSIRSTLGLENNDARYDGYTTKKYIYQNNSASVNHQRATTIVNENIVNYNLQVDDTHSLDAMGGFSYQQYVRKTLAASGNTFMSDIPETNDLGSAETINTPSTGLTKWVLMSYLGRVNYAFKGKYLATVSIRADGSSRYSPGQRWGYFPSAAAAWRVSEEAFMNDIPNMSELKIRGSYGKTGSTAIAPYSTQNLLVTGKAATGNGNFTYYAPGSTYPDALKWETTTQWDIGFDLAMYNNRLRITGDYYYKYTSDLLNTVFLPTSSGYSSTTRNIGQISNRGIELSVEGDVVQKRDFSFTAAFNISHNRNRVDKLADGDDIFGNTFTNYGSGAITIIREGEPLGAFYLFEDAGLTDEGQLSYVDRNNDGAYTDLGDRYVAGSPYPDFIYGLNLDIRYKNWGFNMFWQGSYGNDVFNLSEMRNYSYGQGMNIERKVYQESWREGQDNSHAAYPRIERVGTMRYSDRFLENGSYLRLKNVSVAYFIPVAKLGIHWIDGINVFASAQNYLTFTKYTGMDPEVNSKGDDINNAIDHFTYPNSKTFSFGAKIQF